jgi:hypothetical protein
MSDERQADQTDDPRKQGTGQGYPESNQAETTPTEGTESGPAAGDDSPDAPSTSSPGEGDAGQATGNSRAAG